jgi:hypothetical protein
MAENKVNKILRDGISDPFLPEVLESVDKDLRSGVEQHAEKGDNAENHHKETVSSITTVELPSIEKSEIVEDLDELDAQQIALEQGLSMSRKGIGIAVGYQPDDSLINDDEKRKRVAKGSIHNSSTWLAVLIQRCLNRLAQISS